jgi:hypothetical protein
MIWPSLLSSGRTVSPQATTLVAPARTVGDMQLNRRQVPTGTFCGGNHPEQIEYRYALVDGVEVPDGQSGPRCFRAGCPDNNVVLAREQRGRPPMP